MAGLRIPSAEHYWEASEELNSPFQWFNQLQELLNLGDLFIIAKAVPSSIEQAAP
jgi:hypothetical protein